MIIGMDMDGCLVDFVGSALSRIKQLWGLDLDYEDLVTPRIEDIITSRLKSPVSSEALCSALFQPGFFISMLPRPGAIDAVSTLLYQGHELVIITKAHLQAPHIVKEKAEWLAYHLQNVEYQTIVIQSGGNKDLINVDVLVDDDPDNLEHPTATTICVEHPWNADYRFNKHEQRIPIFSVEDMNVLPNMISVIKNLQTDYGETNG